MRSVLQLRDEERGKACYNGEILFPGGDPCEHTIRQTIWHLRTGRVQWWAKEGDTPSWENPMPDLEFDDVLGWD